jgi:methionyl-tRNA synthetase
MSEEIITPETTETVEAAEEVKAPEMKYATYDDFKKLDMRAGTIRFVEAVEGTDKLLRFLVEFSPEVATMEFTDPETEVTYPVRQIVSGIRNYHPDFEKLVGKTVLYVINLEPRTIRGVESQGMLMAIGEEDCVFMIPDGDISNAGRKVH